MAYWKRRKAETHKNKILKAKLLKTIKEQKEHNSVCIIIKASNLLDYYCTIHASVYFRHVTHNQC